MNDWAESSTASNVGAGSSFDLCTRTSSRFFNETELLASEIPRLSPEGEGETELWVGVVSDTGGTLYRCLA